MNSTVGTTTHLSPHSVPIERDTPQCKPGPSSPKSPSACSGTTDEHIHPEAVFVRTPPTGYRAAWHQGLAAVLADTTPPDIPCDWVEGAESLGQNRWPSLESGEYAEIAEFDGDDELGADAGRLRRRSRAQRTLRAQPQMTPSLKHNPTKRQAANNTTKPHRPLIFQNRHKKPAPHARPLAAGLLLGGRVVASAVDLAATTVFTVGKIAVKTTGAVVDAVIPDGNDDKDKKKARAKRARPKACRHSPRQQTTTPQHRFTNRLRLTPLPSTQRNNNRPSETFQTACLLLQHIVYFKILNNPLC